MVASASALPANVVRSDSGDTGRVDAKFLRDDTDSRVDTKFLRDDTDSRVDTKFLRDDTDSRVDAKFLKRDDEASRIDAAFLKRDGESDRSDAVFLKRDDGVPGATWHKRGVQINSLYEARGDSEDTGRVDAAFL
ncbi:hypothetical protein CVT24_000937 [Panaeolus cyanescens]|uniref:Uncharacterized protein n=1 Tax=Panaeolus cyanescens TaxID=181874 RepID=A0A409YTB5_9AGAR|nr:hypothetical protein CVT24_000937 [Panaeolus cyanescens]